MGECGLLLRRARGRIAPSALARGNLPRYTRGLSHAPARYNLTASTAAALTANTAALDPGDTAYVASLSSGFVFDATSTSTPDGVYVINSHSGTGRWLRIQQPSSVVLRPASPYSCNGVLRTWAELMTVVDASSTPLSIDLDPTGSGGVVITAPAGSWDMKGATFRAFNMGATGDDCTLAIANGASLKNVRGFLGRLLVDCQSTTVGGYSLTWDAASASVSGVFSLIFDGSIITVSGTQPAMYADASFWLELRFFNGAFFKQTGVVATKLVTVLASGTLQLVFSGAGGGTSWFPFLAGGVGASSHLVVLSDGSAPLATPSSSWSGFTLASISYLSPRGPVMTTADRNTISITKATGHWYYDSTVHKPVYWNGTAWVDSQNTAVP